jgi:shikimate dehydrogenase
MNCLYAQFDIKHRDLRKFIESIKLLGITGFNVTVPYKELIIRYLDDLDSSVESVGAVNLVVNRKGKRVGYNSDLHGIKGTVEDHLKFPINNRRVVLIGAGGAARAAIEYLRKARPSSVILANRTIKRARKLQDILQKPMAEVAPVGNLTQRINDLGIGMVINATPVATTAILKSIPSGLRIFDMSYRPSEFPYGKSRIRCDGRYMLAAQASRAFSIFCGVRVSVDEIFQLIKRK